MSIRRYEIEEDTHPYFHHMDNGVLKRGGRVRMRSDLRTCPTPTILYQPTTREARLTRCFGVCVCMCTDFKLINSLFKFVSTCRGQTRVWKAVLPTSGEIISHLSCCSSS